VNIKHLLLCRIHKNYNGWIENLNRDIRANLMAM